MLTVYREIAEPSPELAAYLESRDDLFEYDDGHGRPVLLVENDRPRDSSVTPQIMRITKLFWVLDEDGRLVGKFRDLLKAEAAIASARVTVSVEYDTDDVDAAEDAAVAEVVASGA